MADNDIKRKIDSRQKYHSVKYNGNSNSIPKCYQWIEERLLKTPIPDYRKMTINLVLVPFFIVIKKFSANETFYLTKTYLIKCHKLQPLLPSINEFVRRINTGIERSIENKISPIRVGTMRIKYPQWYDFFNQWNMC